MFTSKKIAIYVATILVLVTSYVLRLEFSKKPQVLPKNQKLIFLATVNREPRISERFQIIAVGDSRLFCDIFPRFHVGDKLKIEGKVSNDGLIFNARVEKVGHVEGVGSFFAGLRNKLAQNMASFLPSREATLVLGTVLGVDEIASEFRDQLIKTGTIHVVVVSGQNLSIVAGLFLAQAKIFGRRRSLILAITAVFLYAILTGFEPPVVRASLMVLAASLAVFFGRQSWPIWNLVLAALVIIFIWPNALFEVSFQLTFAATLGIMTLGSWLSGIFARGPVTSFPARNATHSVAGGPPTNASLTSFEINSHKHKKLFTSSVNEKRVSGVPSTRATPRKNSLGILGVDVFRVFFINNAAVAISAYLFTLPIILFYFGRVSVLAPVANMLVAPVIIPVMILGFLIAIMSLIFAPLAQILAYFAYVPSFYFVKVIEMFATF